MQTDNRVLVARSTGNASPAEVMGLKRAFMTAATGGDPAVVGRSLIEIMESFEWVYGSVLTAVGVTVSDITDAMPTFQRMFLNDLFLSNDDDDDDGGGVYAE